MAKAARLALPGGADITLAEHEPGTAVAQGERRAFRLVLISVLAVSVATVTGLAFYLGRNNAVLDAVRQKQQSPDTAGATRLPVKKFGNWSLACVVDPARARHCSLVFQAVDNTRKHVLFRLSLLHASGGKAVIQILTPPDAVAASGVKFTPGNAPSLAVPFARCLPHACEALLPLSDGLTASLDAADKAQVGFVVARGKPIMYAFPVQGFREGYAAWRDDDMQALQQPGAVAPAITR